MIITCHNCNKKFDIDSNLIPEKGRLLECNSCNHRWFFSKNITIEPVKPVKIKNPVEEKSELTHNDNTNNKIKSDKIKDSESMDLLDDSNKSLSVTSKEYINIDIKKDENQENEVKKKYNILTSTIIFIISFIAFIIIVDTFKYPIGKIFPNVEFLLYNLYESIKDVLLFLKDLT